MELSNPAASSELQVDKPVQASNPKSESVRTQDLLPTIPPTENTVNQLLRSEEVEPTDDLDARLAEGRRRRAQTFSKVTNLFNKIFAE
ncbi:hypothetical protein [Acaryochloris sp. CCMEE 5410]|uniref:hypothetical protein n=1 Tax=Acaryochloris sp. CCMEE 5410 TaxID=310037 RepID=UPI000303EB5D|nr:hypothetical protein [Acaryochloris sp. CCMEE 5410]KAI9133122.1 hypothetical protein ON05_007175 [Acaryochloris sp. CCMEE 5410]